MRNVLIFGIISIFLVSSCEKDEEVINESVDYTPLSIGDYWVYENYSTDTFGIETILPQIDSVIIDRDTIIRGETYYVFEGTNYPNNQHWGILNIVRDSADCLVNLDGIILFSLNNFSDVLYEDIRIFDTDTLYTYQYQMETITGSVVVPTGTYNDVLNYKGTFNINNPMNGVTNPRYSNNYYAPDIGMIMETCFYFSTPTIYGRRLISYNIQ